MSMCSILFSQRKNKLAGKNRYVVEEDEEEKVTESIGIILPSKIKQIQLYYFLQITC